MKFPKTVEAINAELRRRVAAGESAAGAEIVNCLIAPVQQEDGSYVLRTIFELDDGTTFAIDTVERFVVAGKEIHEARSH